MDEPALKLLYDARLAAQAIESFCSGKAEDDYLGDLMLRSAVERQYEVIGEALNRLKKHSPGIADRISDCHRIIGFRNVLAHGYDVVDDRISWDIVRNKLPLLKQEIMALVTEMESGA
jgi:uncharacterized protein with HEPN domain